jgi:uncharacterized protein YndB with AHSA1/START domain
MPDILHQFPVVAPVASVFEAVSSPAGLDRWWTARSEGTPRSGGVYQLWFGPDYDWRAVVTECRKDAAFELQMTVAMPDWVGTRVRFALEANQSGTTVHFAHSGWPEASEHFRISSYCWAMYLRILKRNLEYGEQVPYDKRLGV